MNNKIFLTIFINLAIISMICIGIMIYRAVNDDSFSWNSFGVGAFACFLFFMLVGRRNIKRSTYVKREYHDSINKYSSDN